MKTEKHSGTIGYGNRVHEFFENVKFWLTHKKREKKYDAWYVTCSGFCPKCKYANACRKLLVTLERGELE